MLNQVVLVGRIVSDLKIETNEQGGEVANITIAVSRAYKNEDGEYDTDFVSCTIKGGIAKNAIEYCKKGDLVGVRGKIESLEENIKIIIERLTFLSQSKETCKD